MNKHQQRTRVTRRKLVEAARGIFVRDGFQAARLEDIAKAAGHTRGAFYANFKSKEELFFALLEQQATEQLETLRRGLEACRNAEERLDVLRDQYVKRLGDREWMILMLEFKVFALRHSRRAKIAEMHRRVRASLDLGAIGNLLPKRARIPLQSHEVCRVALEALLSGLVLEYVYDPKRISAEEAADILGRTFDTWLKGKL